jgi:hypothetical protein
LAPSLLCLYSRQRQAKGYRKTLRTNGMLNRSKAVTYEFLKFCVGLNLRPRRTRSNDDVFERCRLGELAHKLCGFRQDLGVYGSHGQTNDERQKKEEHSPYELFR